MFEEIEVVTAEKLRRSDFEPTDGSLSSPPEIAGSKGPIYSSPMFEITDFITSGLAYRGESAIDTV